MGLPLPLTAGFSVRACVIGCAGDGRTDPDMTAGYDMPENDPAMVV
jgi:hypothetical protein